MPRALTHAHTPPSPRIIDGLAEIASQYNALICDIWGVLHNGQVAYRGADAALTQFRATGGRVVLLSNAPRPSTNVAAKLDALGISQTAYDSIITSGDMARKMVSDYGAAGKVGLHIGPPKDDDLIANLSAPFGRLEQADYILLSGLYDDRTETPDDYAAMIQDWRARDLPMLCANPDRQVQFGARVIYCAGAIAELYEQQGGQVIWIGKPHLPVYAHVQNHLASLCDSEPHILAIGDGPKTDIIGAAQLGIDALFITGGLAQAVDGTPLATARDIAAVLAAEKTHAKWAMQHLRWTHTHATSKRGA